MADYYVAPESAFTAVADAIRAKTGGSAELEFPDEFVEEIESIETGSDPVEDYLNKNLSGNIVFDGTSLTGCMFRGQKYITSISLPNVTSTFNNTEPTYAFAEMPALVSFSAPKITRVCDYMLTDCTNLTNVNLDSVTDLGSNIMRGCTSLTTVCFKSAAIVYGNTFNGCTNLETADILLSNGFTNQNNFYGCTKFNTLIIRRSSGVASLNNINNFTNTPFDENGSGGNIYIAKALYDHLGDGTSLDYKVATNWSTIDSYGTITWHAIEGSYYETHYADGTTIPTT